MRRSLVLTDEAARHPFRVSLPPHVCRIGTPARARHARWPSARDLRDFLLAYCAISLAALVFIF